MHSLLRETSSRFLCFGERSLDHHSAATQSLMEKAAILGTPTRAHAISSSTHNMPRKRLCQSWRASSPSTKTNYLPHLHSLELVAKSQSSQATGVSGTDCVNITLGRHDYYRWLRWPSEEHNEEPKEWKHKSIINLRRSSVRKAVGPAVVVQ